MPVDSPKAVRIPGLLLLVLGLCLPGLALGAPAVSSFSPVQGPPGVQVTVLGSGFGSASKVQFGDAPADFTALADNRLIAVVPVDGITGRIRVTNPTTGTGTSATDFMVAPRISSFDPDRSGTNTAVTIEGFNFLSVTNVQFGGVNASFTATAATQIRAIVPAGASNGLIRVTSPAGVGASAESFTVTGPAPIIDFFEPPIGLAGTEVFIQGANFTNPTAVRFNGVNASTFAASAHTQLRALVPASATTGKIIVVTSGGSVTSAVDFVVSGRPFIRSFTPRFGRDGFTQVTIEGLNFNGVTGVGFNGTATGIATPAQNQLLAKVPAGATTGLITVTNASGSGASAENFTVTLAPIITDFHPILGGPGTQVWLDGVNLSNGFTVLKFGTTQAGFTVTGQNGTQVRAIVPASATSGPLTMTNASGSFVTSNSFFVTGSAPYVSELSPAKGPRGTEVIITGGNFTGPATVRFNGVTDPTAAVTALTQIRATVPAGALSGPVTVQTTSGTSTNGPVFHTPPRLTSITPSEGVVGAPVVLAGTNFTDASVVMFNGLSAGFEVTASNRIETVVPVDASSGPIRVVVPGGVIISTNAFIVLPDIDSFAPGLGPVETVVTVHGTTFTNVTGVSFNNVAATFTVVSRYELRATVPAQATTGPIRVTTTDGTAVSTENFLITRSSDLALSMTVAPALVLPGEQLLFTIVASNLGPSVVTGVEISDPLPTGLEVLELTTDLGTVSETNGLVTGLVSALTNGTAVTLNILARPTQMGVYSNAAAVSFLEGDTIPGNNQALVSFTVLSDAARTLDIRRDSPDTVIVNWPTSSVPLTLESTAALTNGWETVTPGPVVVQGQNVVTNEVQGERYYRLRKPLTSDAAE